MFLLGVYLLAIPLILAGFDMRWSLYYYALLPVLRSVFISLKLVDPVEILANDTNVLKYVFDGAYVIGLIGVVIYGVLDAGNVYWGGVMSGVLVFVLSLLYAQVLPYVGEKMWNGMDVGKKDDV
jgi:hypothetical protein